jgi:large subunit ribosomal protein L9e
MSKLSTQCLFIPREVKIQITSRNFVVAGPNGTVRRCFRNVPMDVYLASNDSKKFLKIDAHFAKREHAAILRTVCSHLANLISGVVTGIAYKMRTVYAHFPINLSIGNNGKGLEIRNFLGEKKVRVINLLGGVTCEH